MEIIGAGDDTVTLLGVKEIELINIREGLALQMAAYEKSYRKHESYCTETKCNLISQPQEGRTCQEDKDFLTVEIGRCRQMIVRIKRVLP
jgi:hypothetical protein